MAYIDDDHFRQAPLPRAQQEQVAPHSPEMVNWTSKDYGIRSAANLTAAWKEVWEQWELMNANAKGNRQLSQILDPLNEKMNEVQMYELWNKEYGKCVGCRVYKCWIGYSRKESEGQTTCD